MSLFDDDRPKKPIAHEIGSDLSMLSVDELKARIELLKAEIARSRRKRPGRPPDEWLQKISSASLTRELAAPCTYSGRSKS